MENHDPRSEFIARVLVKAVSCSPPLKNFFNLQSGQQDTLRLTIVLDVCHSSAHTTVLLVPFYSRSRALFRRMSHEISPLSGRATDSTSFELI